MATFVPHSELAKLLGSGVIRTEAVTVEALLEEVRSKVKPEDWSRVSRAALLVNGRSIHALGGMSTPLAPADEVWMVMPAAGG